MVSKRLRAFVVGLRTNSAAHPPAELYSADGSLEASYLSKIRSVLRRLAEIAEELEGTINFKFKSSLETLSKGATHLRLLYHQVCASQYYRPGRLFEHDSMHCHGTDRSDSA